MLTKMLGMVLPLTGIAWLQALLFGRLQKKRQIAVTLFGIALSMVSAFNLLAGAIGLAAELVFFAFCDKMAHWKTTLLPGLASLLLSGAAAIPAARGLGSLLALPREILLLLSGCAFHALLLWLFLTLRAEWQNGQFKAHSRSLYFSIFSGLLAAAISVSSISASNEPFFDYLILLGVSLLTGTAVLQFSYILTICRLTQEQEEARLQEERLRLERESWLAMEKRQAGTAQLRHDLMNHLTVIRTLGMRGETERQKEYIRSLRQKLESAGQDESPLGES